MVQRIDRRCLRARQAEAVQDALTAPLPEIRTNGTWSKDCAPCIGQNGIAQPQFSSNAQQVQPPPVPHVDMN